MPHLTSTGLRQNLREVPLWAGASASRPTRLFKVLSIGTFLAGWRRAAFDLAQTGGRFSRSANQRRAPAAGRPFWLPSGKASGRVLPGIDRDVDHIFGPLA